MTLSDEHRRYLREEAAISDAIMDAVCDTDPDGIGFNLVSTTGREERRIKLIPDPNKQRYRCPSGASSVVSVPPGFHDTVMDAAVPLLIVEGTKQHLTVASILSESLASYGVVGINGCWGWSSKGLPADELVAIPMAGRAVVVMYDADLRTKRDVYDAAKRLQDVLTTMLGAESVRFVHVPAGGKAGLDDVLAMLPPDMREQALLRLVDGAVDSLGRAPAKASSTETDRALEAYGIGEGEALTASTMADILIDNHHLATGGGSVLVFGDGLYHNGQSARFEKLVKDLTDEVGLPSEAGLRSAFRDVEFATITELTVSGKVMPERQDRLLIPFRNGLLDPVTMTLRPHDPTFITTRQFQVDWDEAATADFFVEWAQAQMLPGQLEVLEDIVSQMLDPTRLPVKGGLMDGPSRSGKGTVLRLYEALAGKSHTSAVSLHQLADDRFAAADLYGMTLNIHADLSANDIRDISLLKQALGEDYLRAQRKYGQPFMFRNTALMLFATNAIPSVNEASQAYFSRIVPFQFPNSYIGREDPRVAERLMKELPGIAVRLVRALMARLDRGTFLEPDAGTMERFVGESDRVAKFVRERCEVGPSHWTKNVEVWEAFKRWTDNDPSFKNQGFYRRLKNVDGVKGDIMGGAKGNLPGFNLRIRDHGGSRPLGTVPGTAVGKTSETSETAGDGDSPTFPTFSLTPTYVSDSSEDLTDSLCRGCEKTSETSETSGNGSLVLFDLETGSVDDMHRPGTFTRLVATTRGTHHDPQAVVDTPGVLVAHNGFGFDFPVLTHDTGMDLLARSEAGLLYDTKIGAILADPPPAGLGNKAPGYYSLNSVSQRLGGVGKVDEIQRLARKHGGYDAIPLSDPEYHRYAAGDVRAMEVLLPHMPCDEYAAREMRLMGRLAYATRVVGWRVDVDLLTRRLEEFDRVVEHGTAALVEAGFPFVKDNGEPYKKPHAGKGADEVLERLLLAAGMTEAPSTEGGKISTSKKAWDGYTVTDAARPVLEAIWALNGNRTIYGTVNAALVGDRVYPSIMPYQASGRFSASPGITVMGKRDGKHHERSVYLPEPGHLLVAFDLDQIDARAVAMHCQDEAYMALFCDPDLDAHEEIAFRLWGVRDGKKGEKRNAAKAIGHGWNYGESLPRIARESGLDLGVVRDFDLGMAESFPRLVEWKKETAALAETGGFLDNGFGRQMRPDPARGWTQGPALLGQGLARDLMTEGLLRLPVDLVGNLRAPIHDELIFSVPEADLEDYKAEILKAMQFEFRGVPVTAGFEGAGRDWGAIYGE